jgi:hypothetical protein
VWVRYPVPPGGPSNTGGPPCIPDGMLSCAAGGRCRPLLQLLGASDQCAVPDYSYQTPKRQPGGTVAASRGLSIMRQRTCMTLAAASLVLVLCIGTPGKAQQNIEERRACTPDVIRLCREFVPNAELINKCLMEKKAELSAACHTVMFGPEPNVATPPAIPVKQPSLSLPPKPKVLKKSTWKRSRDCDDDDD